jgi:hypothetical protein
VNSELRNKLDGGRGDWECHFNSGQTSSSKTVDRAVSPGRHEDRGCDLNRCDILIFQELLSVTAQDMAE